jgi:hypothetical protein
MGVQASDVHFGFVPLLLRSLISRRSSMRFPIRLARRERGSRDDPRGMCPERSPTPLFRQPSSAAFASAHRRGAPEMRTRETPRRRLPSRSYTVAARQSSSLGLPRTAAVLVRRAPYYVVIHAPRTE